MSEDQPVDPAVRSLGRTSFALVDIDPEVLRLAFGSGHPTPSREDGVPADYPANTAPGVYPETTPPPLRWENAGTIGRIERDTFLDDGPTNERGDAVAPDAEMPEATMMTVGPLMADNAPRASREARLTADLAHLTADLLHVIANYLQEIQ